MIGFYDYTVIATFLSLISGVFGIAFALNGSPMVAIFCLMLSGLLDMFDGKIAATRERTLPEKRFGLHTDSLADMVNFGILPVVIGYAVGLNSVWFAPVFIVYMLAVLIRLAYFTVCQESRLTQGDHPFRYYEGFPASYCVLIIPLIYLLRLPLGDTVFRWFYMVMLLGLAVSYVLKFRVIKPNFKGLFILLGLGVIEFTLLVWLAK
ncbi:MAG: CDP-alcohol phosphatidyltransferase family protein [Clostridia bacterium]|nr:CDP-alcohol phosphatidyltransferase family protein [Clostridia bacterium]